MSAEDIERAGIAASRRWEGHKCNGSYVEPAPLLDIPEDIAAETRNMLNAVERFLGKFVAYPSVHEHRAHTLWIAHTHLMECWESTPRIAFLSPEPGSGKSRALEVTEPLVPRPIHSVNTTPAYLFRKVSDPAGLPTILYDEIDTVFSGPQRGGDTEAVRGMINAGHRKGATAGRCVVRGKVIETEELEAYCAVALAGLDDLPDTIMSRSVVVRMRRRTADEDVAPWRPRLNRPEAQRIRNRLEDWAVQAKQALAGDDWWPEMPAGVEDRDADVWEALLTVADLAGGQWAQNARASAVALVAASKRNTPSVGILLLQDISKVFEQSYEANPKLHTDAILSGLVRISDSPWSKIRKGQPIDANTLARMLRRYGIAPKPQRIGQHVFKGYAKDQFADAWKRYPLPVEDDDPEPEVG
jgi:hypothetical protein